LPVSRRLYKQRYFELLAPHLHTRAPLALVLCAAQLPTTIAERHMHTLRPCILRALQTTPPTSGVATAATATAVGATAAAATAVGATAAAATADGAAAVRRAAHTQLAALVAVHVLLSAVPSDWENDLATLVKALRTIIAPPPSSPHASSSPSLASAAASGGGVSGPRARQLAVETLDALGACMPYARVFPLIPAIDAALATALRDHKRVVRVAAANARNHFFLLRSQT